MTQRFPIPESPESGGADLRGSRRVHLGDTVTWRDGIGWNVVDVPESGPVRVADSWRIADGRVRRFDAHRDRFASSVAATGAYGRGAVEAFMDAALALAVTTPGCGFPRVRLVGDRLVLDLRPGPPQHEAVAVHVLPPGDPRVSPLVKGPDLASAGDLVAAARGLGAGEVLIRGGRGVVLECGWASLVWWEGDTLCVPAAGLPVLPSVTRGIVEDLARADGLTVRGVEARLPDLDGREAWLLNAYQGLRLVTGWVGADLTPGPPHRFGTWRAALDAVQDRPETA